MSFKIFETKNTGMVKETQIPEIQFSGAGANEEKQNFIYADI